MGHPDKAFVTNLITGLRKGFFTGISEPLVDSLECPNNLSAKAQPEIVSQLIIKKVKKGFLVGPFRTPPFSLSPLGLAEGTVTIANIERSLLSRNKKPLPAQLCFRL